MRAGAERQRAAFPFLLEKMLRASAPLIRDLWEILYIKSRSALRKPRWIFRQDDDDKHRQDEQVGSDELLMILFFRVTQCKLVRIFRRSLVFGARALLPNLRGSLSLPSATHGCVPCPLERDSKLDLGSLRDEGRL